jgi:hypothetical protein
MDDGPADSDVPARGSGETAAHRRLKALALAWARGRGWEFAAEEVRVPRSGYRADVAAAASEEGGGGTVILECKQARADLRRDAHAEEAVRARIAEFEARRGALAALLAVHRPDLRRGEALWAEYDGWDGEAARHRTYRAVMRRLAALRRRAADGTKFSRLRRWRSADRLYLVVEADIQAAAEAPAGWGVLVHEGGRLVEARPADAADAGPAQRAALRTAIGRRLAGPPAPGAGGLLFPGFA